MMMSVEYRWWWLRITALNSLLALGTTFGSVRRAPRSELPAVDILNILS